MVVAMGSSVVAEVTAVADEAEVVAGVLDTLQTLQMAFALAIIPMVTRVTFVPLPSRALGSTSVFQENETPASLTRREVT